MKGFDDGLPDDDRQIACPECLASFGEAKIRRHLNSVHGWNDQRVDDYFDDQSPRATPDSEGSMGNENQAGKSFDDVNNDGSTEIVDTGDESELCDCDPEYKETAVIQKSTGANVGPIGGNRGDGVPVIICKSCGKRFEVRDAGGDKGLTNTDSWDDTGIF